jgi:hypothetical protein
MASAWTDDTASVEMQRLRRQSVAGCLVWVTYMDEGIVVLVLGISFLEHRFHWGLAEVKA